MQILVSGATGVVGSRAVPLLVARGHRVEALGRSPERLAALERAGAATARTDLFDTRRLQGRSTRMRRRDQSRDAHAGDDDPDALPGGLGRERPRPPVGSANLVDAALFAGVKRFVQESFAPAYPDCGDRWIDEATPLQPTRYNRTLLDAEASAARFTAESGGGAGVVLRFGMFYGPDSRFLRDMVGLVRRGWVPLPGHRRAFVSPVSHDDAAAAAVAALELGAGTYNVVDDEPVTRRAFFDTFAAALGVPAPKFPPLWAVHLLGTTGELLSRSLRISNRKLRGASAWSPKVPSVREGWAAVVSGLEKTERTAAA